MAPPVPREITIFSAVRRFSINKRKAEVIIDTVGAYCGFDAFQVHVTFVTPARIRKLNQEFRQKDRSTDVLSFPIQTWKNPVTVKSKAAAAKPRPLPNPIGDIVISVEDAQHNARLIGQPLSREVCFLLIHGFLHLCGHDHMKPKEEKVMLRAQRVLLRHLEATKPPLWTRLVSPAGSKRRA